jgi:acyl-homoserine lactone acylase PvdQ
MKASLIKITVLLSLLALAACAHQETDPELARLAARAQNVTIIRDDFGVPHIYGKTDADAVFGLLYAQSEDDFNRIEQNYLWATGRLAEVEGESALFSDLRARLYMTTEEAQQSYAEAPDWLKKLCDAFADGVNYYLATHPDVKPRLLTHFEPWMPMFFSEGSIGGDIESVDLAGIETFYGDGPALDVLPKEPAIPGSRPAEFKEPTGSNGIAISGALTESGNAMLLINPHTSFFFRSEVHVISEEGLNAYGAVTWGQFFVYQGFNEHTGWMHTSTYVDFMDDFVEDVFRTGKPENDQDSGQLMYRYGVETRRVRASEVTLKYKDGEGVSERTFTLYHTHHGPVTHMQDGKWVVTKINWDPVRALQQSFTRTKLSDYSEFRKMMELRTNSSNNTVFADSQGNIAYFHGNFVPKRNPGFDFSQPVDGSDPATDWLGLHEVDELVTLLNPPTGWIQNCNSTPFTAAGEFSPKHENYPAYMAPDPENFRALHAVRVLTGAHGLTLDKLIELAYDPYLPGFERLIPGLVEAWERAGANWPDLAEPIAVLRNWNLEVAADSVAMTLAHFYGVNYSDRVEGRADAYDLEKIDLINFLGTGTPDEERLQVFSDTVAMLKADFGRWNMPWGEVNRYQRINGDIQQPFNDASPSLPVGMASGNWGALASFGAKRYPGTARIYGTTGNSFIAVVEFGDKVRALSMLAGGGSGDPTSAHFADQSQRYVDRQFKEVAYYREEVERRAERTYHPGE